MRTKSHSLLNAIKAPASPFPGLRPFEPNESRLFFGRDEQTEKMMDKLARTRFLAVVGTSGSGKSSLVRAGLMPALHSGMMAGAGSKWRIAIMRPSNDPIGNLARALNAPEVFGSDDAENQTIQIAIAEATLRLGSRGLIETVCQNVMPQTENLLVVVDQFEELFRFAREARKARNERYDNDAAAFVKLLLESGRKFREAPDKVAKGEWTIEEAKQALQKEPNIYVVLTMRSDFLGDCSQFWDLPEAINESQYLIPRLTRDQLREVIEGPVAVGGGQIAPRLVNQLLNDITDNQDQLPILQHALMRTWDEWKQPQHDHHTARGVIDICCYEGIGGMAEALSRHADEAYDELDDTQKKIAEKMLKALTEKGEDNREIRRPATLGELCAVTGAGEGEVKTVVDAFRRPGRSFLMPPPETPLHSHMLIDISHESLIRVWKRLQQWANEEAESATIYRRLVETTERHNKGRGELWRGADLQVGLEWQEKNLPTEAWAQRYHPDFHSAMKFLKESQDVREKEALDRENEALDKERQLKQIRHLLYVANINLAQQAYEAANIARLRELLDEHLPTATTLGQDDVRSFAWYYFWRFSHNELATLSGHTGLITSVALSADGKTLATGSSDRTVKLWDTTTYQELATLKGHSGAVESVAFSPDGKTLATGGNDRTVRLWDRTTGQELASLKKHSSYVRAVTFSPDGKTLASGSSDHTVKLWDTTTHKELATLKGRLGSLRSVAFSQDGEILATGGKNQSVELWDRIKLQAMPRLRGHGDSITSVAFSPDEKLLATGSLDRTVKLWDAAKRKELVTVEGHQRAVRSVAFSPEGQTIATGSDDSMVRLWDTKTGKELSTLVGHLSSALCVAFSTDGKTLISGSTDRTVKIWDTAKRQRWENLIEPSSYKLPYKSPFFSKEEETTIELSSSIKSLAFSPDGKTLATFIHWESSPDGESQTTFSDGCVVKLWDAATRHELAAIHLPDHGGFFDSFALAFSPDGNTLAIAGQATVRLWGINTRQDIATLEHYRRDDWLDRFGQYIPTQETEALEQEFNSHYDFAFRTEAIVSSIAFSPDGKILATISGYDGIVKLWDTTTHQELRKLPSKNRNRTSISLLAFSPDGKILAASRGKAVTLWNASNYREMAPISVELSADNEDQEDDRRNVMSGRNVMSVAFSPDSKILAAGDDQRTVKLWDTTTWRELATLRGQEGAIRSLAFSPDGKTLVTGSNDSTIKLWDTATWQELAILKGHTASVHSIVFWPNDRVLATGSEDGTVKLWVGATDEEVALCRNKSPRAFVGGQA